MRIGNILYIKFLLKVTLTRQSDEDTNKFLFHSDRDDDDKVGNVIIKKINLKVPLNELNSEPQKNLNHNLIVIKKLIYYITESTPIAERYRVR